MTVTTHAAASFSFVFTCDLYNTHYIMYFMTHSFYAFLAPPIVVGVLLASKSRPGFLKSFPGGPVCCRV